MEVEEGVNSFWHLHSFSNDTKAEFNTVFINIVLLFIQNNSYFENKLKHAYLHPHSLRFIFDVTCLSANSGDKGLFRSASILQIADVVRRVVF